MYSEKEIQISLRKHIALTGNTTIDEQSIISILNEGTDRDFDNASKVIRAIRDQYGVKRQIPEWLRMLTFRLIFDCMASENTVTVCEKKQEELLSALGFNKKVFDGTSWQMYSPDMKLRQSRFNPVDFPFTYAEVESNPIYVAMLHHLISEARIMTNTFIDVFGKMGYVPAFCAEGYSHKLIFTDTEDSYLKYYHGITDRPTKTYKVLQRYMQKIDEVLAARLKKKERDEEIRSIVSDAALFRGLYSSDLSEYAAAKFCDMCFRKPYWEPRNDEYGSNEGYYENIEFLIDDYSSIKRAKQFIEITKDEFVLYAKALKKVECYQKSSAIRSTLYNGWFDIAERRGALLYVDAPKISEYERFDYDSKKYMRLIKGLLNYKGDWILTFKNYYGREGSDDEQFANLDFKERLRNSKRPLYEYKYITKNKNVRNGISFITTIDFGVLTTQEFQDKYHINLPRKTEFVKLEVR